MYNRILVICDDRNGSNHQAIGLAQQFAKNFNSEIIKVTLEYNNLVKFPDLSWLFKGYYFVKNKNLLNTKADLVIAAGRRACLAAKIYKKQNNAPVIMLLWPGKNIAKSSDVIILPTHDKNYEHENIIRILGAFHHLSDEKLEQAKIQFENFGNIQNKKIACLIGGSHNNGKFTIEATKKLVDKITEIAEQENAFLLITTSRRTGKRQNKLIKDNLEKYGYFYDLTGDNPYLAYLAYADEIIVTSDSIAMISEAISTGKPVYVFDDKKLSGKKHKKFLNNLLEKEYVKLLNNYSYFENKKIDILSEVFKQVLEKLR